MITNLLYDHHIFIDAFCSKSKIPWEDYLASILLLRGRGQNDESEKVDNNEDMMRLIQRSIVNIIRKAIAPTKRVGLQVKFYLE